MPPIAFSTYQPKGTYGFRRLKHCHAKAPDYSNTQPFPWDVPASADLIHDLHRAAQSSGPQPSLEGTRQARPFYKGCTCWKSKRRTRGPRAPGNLLRLQDAAWSTLLPVGPQWAGDCFESWACGLATRVSPQWRQQQHGSPLRKGHVLKGHHDIFLVHVTQPTINPLFFIFFLHMDLKLASFLSLTKRWRQDWPRCRGHHSLVPSSAHLIKSSQETEWSHGNIQGQVERGSEQPDPADDVPAHCRGVGLDGL